jgi:hypothetical protein
MGVLSSRVLAQGGTQWALLLAVPVLARSASAIPPNRASERAGGGMGGEGGRKHQVDIAGCVGLWAALSTADGRSLVRRSYLRIQPLTWHPLGSGGSLRLGAPCVGAAIYRARRCPRARIGGFGAAPRGGPRPSVQPKRVRARSETERTKTERTGVLAAAEDGGTFSPTAAPTYAPKPRRPVRLYTHRSVYISLRIGLPVSIWLHVFAYTLTHTHTHTQ